MSVVLLDPVSKKAGGVLTKGALGSDKLVNLPTFTCCHCNRIVVMRPDRTRARNTCRKCMRWTCDAPGCVAECNPFKADMDRAFIDLDNQPWLLRHNGWPVARIYGPNGGELLVLRKDLGRARRHRVRSVANVPM